MIPVNFLLNIQMLIQKFWKCLQFCLTGDGSNDSDCEDFNEEIIQHKNVGVQVACLPDR